MKNKSSIHILYRSATIVAVDKPSGLLTMSAGTPDRGGKHGSGRGTANDAPTLVSELSQQLGQRVFTVHRLDRDTSGVLLMALDYETKRMLQDNWDAAVLERKYVALVRGVPPQQEGTVTSWLKENPKSLKMSSCPYDNGGQYAVTHYRVLSSSDEWSLVEFELETGRKNQIRVHAAVMGCPVAGDRKYWDLSGRVYNPATDNPVHRLGLHARTLSVVDPHTGRTLSFRSPLPRGFKL